jgi:hypothetical protein
MPPFRIHQTRNRPERILIRLMQGRYVLPNVVPVVASAASVANPAASVPAAAVPEKKKTTISLKQIKQIISLLQTSEHKNISKLLSPELRDLLTVDEDKVDDVEEEEHDFPELPEDDEEDLLIIDVDA